MTMGLRRADLREPSSWRGTDGRDAGLPIV
jgi:hypothetical protein